MSFYFSSVTKALYDTDVFPVASLPANKVEISEAAYAELMTKQNQGYVIFADGSGNPYTVNQSEASATDIKHAASVATTVALGHVKIGNTMTAANDGTLDLNDGAVGTSKLANGAVETSKLANGAVGTSKLANDAVETSKLANGAVGTSKLANDAVTADKVKDNETLPVNISGSAALSKTIYEDGSAGEKRQVHIFGTENTDGLLAGWRKIATITKLSNSFSSARICGKIFTSAGNWGESLNYEDNFQIRVNFTNSSYNISHKPSANIQSLLRLVEVSPNSVYEVQVQPQGLSSHTNFWVYTWVDKYYPSWSIAWKDDLSVAGSEGTVITNYSLDVRKFRLANGQVGSPTTSVYVDPNGQVKPCNTPVVIGKILNILGNEITDAEISTPDANNHFLGNVFISLTDKRIIDFTLSFHMFARNSSNTPINEEITFTVKAGNREVFKTIILPSMPSANFISSLRCTFIADANEQIYIYVSRINVNVATVSLSLMKLQGIAIPVS